MKTDKHLYDGIGFFYKILQKMLARHKVKRAKKLKAKLCMPEPKYRDVSRYSDVVKAIKYWENSKDW